MNGTMKGEIKMEVFKRVVTHSTVFHADDVFGVAMWKLINPNIEVIRTLNPQNYESDDTIIFDVGNGKYDHHDKEALQYRPKEDGTYFPTKGEEKCIPYCGFGLMWRDYGYLLCPNKVAWKRVDKQLVIPIDKTDNGVNNKPLSMAIKAMNPAKQSEEESNKAFFEAVEVAKVLLKAHVNRANESMACVETIINSYKAGPTEELLILDEYMPWVDIVSSDDTFKDILFTVYPSQRGGWNVQTIKRSEKGMANRMNFPKEWIGNEDPERGIHFSHASGFLIACDTKEQAISVAMEAIEKGKEDTIVASIDC